MSVKNCCIDWLDHWVSEWVSYLLPVKHCLILNRRKPWALLQFLSVEWGGGWGFVVMLNRNSVSLMFQCESIVNLIMPMCKKAANIQSMSSINHCHFAKRQNWGYNKKWDAIIGGMCSVRSICDLIMLISNSHIIKCSRILFENQHLYLTDTSLLQLNTDQVSPQWICGQFEVM